MRIERTHRGGTSVQCCFIAVLSFVVAGGVGCSSTDPPADGGGPPGNDAGRTDVIDAGTPEADGTDGKDARTIDADASPPADADASTDRAPDIIDERSADGEGGACTVGSVCGVDCGLPEQAPCWACGTLYYTSNCECRAMQGAGACIWPDCRTPSVGAEGDYCGTYWWCDRPCGAGLSCEAASIDSGWINWLRTCQRTDAGVDVTSDADVTPDADVATSDADANSDVGDVRSCEVSGICGIDCSGPEQAPCWACGTLYTTENCECRARPGGGICTWPDCSTPAIGQAGDYCGTYWWCNRACAAGLACRPARPDATNDWTTTCQPDTSHDL